MTSLPPPPPGQPTRRGVCVLVQNVDGLGGSERQARLLAGALARAGERVVLVTTSDAPLARGLRERVEGYELWRLPLLGFESTATGIAASRGCDLLYAVGIMMGSFAVRIGRVLRAPVVIKLAGMGAPGDMSTLDKLPPARREALRAELETATLVCVAAAVEEEALLAGFTRLVRIPNGVALPYLAPVRPVSADDTVLYVGRLQHAKGVDLLVRALPRVPEATLLLAGEGPDRANLERLARELGVEGRVHFLGRRDDVPGLLRGARVVCAPSRSEGLSNALLEALAAGAPVVASAIAPNREVLAEPSDVAAADVERGRAPWVEVAAGVVVTPEDPQALAAGLSAALASASLRARLSSAGPLRVVERFGIAAVAQRYRALFASLPRQRPGMGVGLRFAGARAATLRRALRRR